MTRRILWAAAWVALSLTIMLASGWLVVVIESRVSG